MFIMTQALNFTVEKSSVFSSNLPSSINNWTNCPLFEISEVSVGQHFYWQLGDYQVHGQVLITSWVVLGLIALLSLSANRNLKSTPDGLQNLTEYITEFIRDLAKTQIGEEEYLTWVPFLGTIFLLFLFPIGPEPFFLGD